MRKKGEMMFRSILSASAAAFLLSACGNPSLDDPTTKGALIGAASGAVAGQIIGRDTKGTLIGTALGAAAGAAIGHATKRPKYYKDRNGRTYYIDANGNAVYVE
jgi:uncharacterized protein YcfJ